MSDRARGVRLAQTLTPFGIGAIYDFLGESLVGCDTTYWKQHGDTLRSPRLEQALGVEEFRSPPVRPSAWFSKVGPRLPYVRFPQWLFCQQCRRLIKWRIADETPNEPPKCRTCAKKPQLVPMRFVITCERGHLGDVPWDFWAHFGAKEPSQKQCRRQDGLRFTSRRGAGSGLASLQVSCGVCKASRSLAGISSEGSLKPMNVSCPGKQPWQRAENAVTCSAAPHVLQRGASNIYFALIQSALDIPPHSSYQAFSNDTLAITSTPHFKVIMSAPDGPLTDMLINTIASELSVPYNVVKAVVDAERESPGGATPKLPPNEENVDLETGEWMAFNAPSSEVGADDRDRFLTREVQLLDAEARSLTPLKRLESMVSRVVLATRLREVRALTGFTRYVPRDDPDYKPHVVQPDLGAGLEWLPAIEVFGEGIFLALDEAAVHEWEQRQAVQRRAALIESRRQRSFIGNRLRPTNARRIMLHTLAHVLIRQMAFESGYASASLRERIYSKPPSDGPPQAGVLIYTAAGDVEGTLGGLARQGQPPRLAHTLLAALEASAWCSSDPICMESRGQGFGAMNLAACHACSLVSETSCDSANTMLDRALLVGGSDPELAFFAEVLDSALAAATTGGTSS